MKKRLKWVGIIFVVLIMIGAVTGGDTDISKKVEENTEKTAIETQQNETDHEWINFHFAEMMEAQQRFEAGNESEKEKIPKNGICFVRLNRILAEFFRNCN